MQRIAKKTDKRKTLPQLFKKGQSGNPLGGAHPNWKSRNQWFHDIVKGQKDDLVKLVMDKALNGNYEFCELAISRLVPQAPQEDFHGITGLKEAKTWQEKIDCVINAVGEGKITPSQSQFLINTIQAGKKMYEDDALMKLEKRMDKIEGNSESNTLSEK